MPNSASIPPGIPSDRYRIERELGRGGMATVYLAEDLRHNRRVAVKVLRPELAGTIAAERFQREIKIAASLAHPGILPLHEAAVSEGDDQPLAFVMPYIEGDTLRARLRAGPLPVADAVAIAADVAGALDYAHRRGIVHRDIKPENILLVEGRAVVADFGVAHAVAEAGGDRLTETGIALGTPAYMSPEQIAGDRELDGRSDVFSLGVVLYEMLAGEAPFSATTAAATIARIATGSAANVRTRRGDVPPGLAAIVHQALAANPDERFQTAEAFARALRGLPSTSTRGRRLAYVGGAIVVLVAIAATVALSLRHRGSSSPLPSIAVLPFANESADSADKYIGQGVAEELLDALADVPGVRVASRTSSFALAGSSDMRDIGRSLDVDAVLEGSIRRAAGTLRVTARLVDARRDSPMWSDSFDRPASELFDVQESIARAIVDRLRLRLTSRGAIVRRRTVDPAAHDLVLRAAAWRDGRSSAQLVASVALLERAVALDSNYAEAWAALADVYLSAAIFRDQARLPGAAGAAPAEMLRRARDAAERALRLDSTSAAAHEAFGLQLFRYDWNWAGAERELRRAIALNPTSASAYQSYHRFLRSLGRFDEARRMLDSASKYGGPDAQVGGTARGRVSYFAHEFPRALRETLGDPRGPQTRVYGTWLAQIYIQLRQYPQAESTLARWGRGDQPGLRISTAYLDALAGRPDSARALLAAIRGSSDELPTSEAAVQWVLGDTTAAFAALQRAIDDRDPLVVDLKVNPWLDPMRTTPRFRAMMARLAFPR